MSPDLLSGLELYWPFWGLQNVVFQGAFAKLKNEGSYPDSTYFGNSQIYRLPGLVAGREEGNRQAVYNCQQVVHSWRFFFVE